MKFRPVLFLSITLSLLDSSLFAEKIKYKVADIPDELKLNAKAVVRKNEITFEIKSIRSAKTIIHYAITVLNKNGVNNSVFFEFYDRFRKIRNIKAAIYNESGELIKHYSLDDILDYSAVSGYSIYEDNRIKVLDPNYRTFPFTVEYSYDIDYDGLLAYPEWQVYSDYNLAIQNSSFKVIAPKGIDLRYLEKNNSPKVNITNSPDQTIYEWKASNWPALLEEQYSPVLIDYTPVVYTAPSEFEIGGFPGKCNSWIDFGLWINSLNKERDILSAETVMKLKQLTSTAKTDYEKVAILYKYMQDKTRYVSIQVGIGGWQPFDALTVDRLSYGDCKALANYMKALLSAVDIKSYYTLVYAGEKAHQLLFNFPSNQFNHAILCVPINKDTLWLECTNQHMPCGYIGTFTDDRPVLIIDDAGGHITRTRSYSAKENVKSQRTDLLLDDSGHGLAKVQTRYTGIYYDELYRILYSDNEDRKRLLYERIKIPSYELPDFSYSVENESIPAIIENLDLQLPNYAARLNDRMLVPVNVMNKLNDLPKQTGDRKSGILLRRPYIEVDSVYLSFPSTFSIEKLPESVSISSFFGEYKAQIVQHQTGGIIYVRRFEHFSGSFPSTAYPDLEGFLKSISFADNNFKILLHKKP